MHIQNADILFGYTQDRAWLAAQLSSVNLAADNLLTLITDDGRIRGGGYYVEFPARLESDGVAQCYGIDALRRVAALNHAVGDDTKAGIYDSAANRVRQHFVTRFWAGDHFAEYWHPERGFVSTHGLTDVDWAAIATGVATPEQENVLWPRLKNETAFYYGGMPTGIATRPETYQDWEFSRPNRHDLAAMGRVWYLESWARARMGDADGLLDTLRRVIRVGKENGYSWRERYEPDGKGGSKATGPNTYCEYPANLIRIVQRFVMGVEFQLDGSVVLAPTVPADFWRNGFGQELRYRECRLRYHFDLAGIKGEYAGDKPQRLRVRLMTRTGALKALVAGQPAVVVRENDLAAIELPAAGPRQPAAFQIAPVE